MGIAIGGGVAPVYMALTWSKASATGAITGAFSGLALGIVAWLVTCQAYYGSITIDNLGGDYPMLAGAPPFCARAARGGGGGAGVRSAAGLAAPCCRRLRAAPRCQARSADLHRRSRRPSP